MLQGVAFDKNNLSAVNLCGSDRSWLDDSRTLHAFLHRLRRMKIITNKRPFLSSNYKPQEKRGVREEEVADIRTRLFSFIRSEPDNTPG